VTEEEHRRLQLEAEAIALRAMLRVCAGQLRAVLPAQTHPDRERWFREFRALLEQTAAQELAIPGLPPAMSNLLSDLWREALERSARLLLSELSRS